MEVKYLYRHDAVLCVEKLKLSRCCLENHRLTPFSFAFGTPRCLFAPDIVFLQFFWTRPTKPTFVTSSFFFGSSTRRWWNRIWRLLRFTIYFKSVFKLVFVRNLHKLSPPTTPGVVFPFSTKKKKKSQRRFAQFDGDESDEDRSEKRKMKWN